MSNHQGQNFRRFLKSLEISPDDAAQKLDIARATLYNWYKEERFDSDQLEKIEKAGYKFLDKSLNVSHETITKQTGNIYHVPLHAYGGFLRDYQNILSNKDLEPYTSPGITGEHFSFEVEGMSMFKKGESMSLEPKDVVIARPMEKLEDMIKGKIYVLQTIDGIIVKVFDKISENKAHFHSLNPDYDGEVMPLKSLKRIYFVVRVLKNPYS